MSRIGKMPISIPEKTDVKVSGSVITVKGDKGELIWTIPATINVEIKDGEVRVTRTSDELKSKALHGLTRSKIFNMIKGVNDGYEKIMDIFGVGFKVEVSGTDIILNVGLSHPVKLPILPGTTVKVNKNEISVSGIDKEVVGEMAAQIRGIKPPEPYKGKGIKYRDEVIRRKAGKTAKSGA